MMARHPKFFDVFIKLGETEISDSDQVFLCLLFVFETLIGIKAVIQLQFEQRDKPSTYIKLLQIPSNFMILGFLFLVEE